MSLDTLLPALHDPANIPAATDLAALSNLDRADRDRLRTAWGELSIQRRRDVIDVLADLAEDNVELNFNSVFLIGLEDDDVQVRAQSIKALWEYEGQELATALTALLADPEAIVRGEAALGLGRFLLRAELDDVPLTSTGDIEQALRRVANDQAELVDVRGRAVEALGVVGQDWVHDLIDDAYESGDRRLAISAVHAMGRSADVTWISTVIAETQSDDPEMRFEAAVAAGSLGEDDAVQPLAALTDDDDAEVQEAAIAALGEIGGPSAREVLHTVAESSTDERVLEAVSDALAAADFVEDPLGIKLYLDRSVADDADEDEE